MFKPSYTSGDYIGIFFYERLDFHINWQYFTQDSPMWYSIHSFGLPLLMAPFFLGAQHLHIAPLFAMQFGMVLLQALGVVLVYLYSLELVRHNVAALIAAVTLLGSMSFLSLAGQIFPDLLTAAVLTGSLLCLARLRRQPQSLLPMAILSTLAGFDPYLHVRPA
jgi:4-amino-4-deoxy-L-arabinose transferase-like glycosyltransferase